MTVPALATRELGARMSALADGFAQLDGLRSESLLKQDAGRSLTQKERVVYGGCHHIITIIQYGLVPLHEAVTGQPVACFPAVLLRALIEWCARAHWLLWLADDDSVAVFLSGEPVEHKDGDAVSVLPPGTPAPPKRSHMTLTDFVNMCREHEQTQGNRSFLGVWGIKARRDKFNGYVHGDADVMLSGFSTDTESQEFSHEVISGMTFVFGGAMFMAYRNIAKILEANRATLGLIRKHEERFYRLFPAFEQQP